MLRPSLQGGRKVLKPAVSVLGSALLKALQVVASFDQDASGFSHVRVELLGRHGGLLVQDLANFGRHRGMVGIGFPEGLNKLLVQHCRGLRCSSLVPFVHYRWPGALHRRGPRCTRLSKRLVGRGLAKVVAHVRRERR